MSKTHFICFLELANVSHHVRQMDMNNAKRKGNVMTRVNELHWNL